MRSYTAGDKYKVFLTAKGLFNKGVRDGWI